MVKTYAEMRFSIIFILSLAAVLVQGCQYGGTVDCRLVEADSLMASKPGKSLEILEGIDGNRLGKRERAYYALLLSQARYRNYIEFTDDSLITEAVRYYEASGDRRNLAYAYFYAGCIAGELGDDEKDLSLTQKAAKAAEGTEDYWLLTYFIIGAVCLQAISLMRWQHIILKNLKNMRNWPATADMCLTTGMN